MYSTAQSSEDRSRLGLETKLPYLRRHSRIVKGHASPLRPWAPFCELSAKLRNAANLSK